MYYQLAYVYVYHVQMYQSSSRRSYDGKRKGAVSKRVENLLSTLWKFDTWTTLCEIIEEVYTCYAEKNYTMGSEKTLEGRKCEQILFGGPLEMSN